MTTIDLAGEPDLGDDDSPATEPALVERVRRSIVGDGELLAGPYGPRRVTYADWTASGRALGFVEAGRARPRRWSS